MESPQSAFALRFEWGLEGLRALAPGAACVVVVDVLSFSTCVDVALARGARVLPYRFRDAGAAAFARGRGAELAVARSEMTDEHPWSLSPVSLERLQPGARLVLPSPNGATLCVAGAELGARVFCGCLRNAAAVARAARAIGGPIAVIAAGEQWPDATLRPSFEDLVGAGAVLDRLGAADASPEARSAVAAFRAAAPDLAAQLAACTEGGLLAARGFADDVRCAAHLDVSGTAPLLDADGLVDANAGP